MKSKKINKKVLRLLNSKLPGFSLIELALVLIIIGILAGAVFKGQDVLYAAKIRSVLNEIDRIRTAAILYHDSYGQWPGNDSLATSRFGETVINGKGSGLITGPETTQFWTHLTKAEHLSESTPPPSRLGGQFSVEGDHKDRKNYLILSQPEKGGLLTPKQAADLKAKVGESDPTSGQIQIIEGADSPTGSCIRDGTYNLSSKALTCILRVALH